MAERSSMSSSARQARMNALQEDLRTKQFMFDRLGLQLWRCTFTYSPPEPDFDSTKVIGTIFSLIEWYDPRYCTALDAIAGERLFSVVVDSEDTGLLFLQKGKLMRSTTFVMLDIVNGDVIDRETLTVAQQLGGGPENVKLALDLVSFDRKYEPVMNWVFGKALVVRDWDTAEKLAYHPAVECCCVTVDGAVIKPYGAMICGLMIEEPSVFQTLEKRKELKADLKNINAELALLNAEELQAVATSTE